MIMSREWCMPNKNTFEVKPIKEFVNRYLQKSKISIDPFARNSTLCTHTNDLSPETKAKYHLEAEAFCRVLQTEGVIADLCLFDPPYSPRQCSEVYKSVGMKVSTEETQTGALYKRVRDAIDTLIIDGGYVLSFGWNSVGMGIKRGYILEEVLLVCSGGAHNDTICIAEKKGSVKNVCVEKTNCSLSLFE